MDPEFSLLKGSARKTEAWYFLVTFLVFAGVMNRSPNKRPEYWLFHFSALCAVGVCCTLVWHSRQLFPVNFPTFMILCSAGFLLSLFGAWAAARSAGQVGLWSVLWWCAVLRLVCVAGDPIYEDDYFRYLWDGRQTIETGSPYGDPPADYFLSETDEVWSEVLDNINNPEIGTIYGPVNQYVFALAYWLAPADVKALQWVMAATDWLAILLLALLMVRMGVPHFGPLVLYGFSPLVLKEFSLTAHPDVLAIFGMVVGLLLWHRGQLRTAALALAFAVSAKIFAFLLVPLILRWHWVAWAIFFATTALLHIPLGYGAGGGGGLAAMAGEWLFNAPLYFMLLNYVGMAPLKWTLLTVFGAGCAAYFFLAPYHREQPTKMPRGDYLYLAMLFAVPVFNPWYYPMLLVFAVIYPSAWAWVGSLTVLFAYATGLQLESQGLEPYGQPAWALWVEFLPLIIAALVSPGRRWVAGLRRRG